MLIPYLTDCYRDSRPYGTIGLLLANAAVFAAVLAGAIDGSNWTSNWAELDLLEGLRSQFFHQDIWHLLGNLLGLWIFGQVIEGAIGTRAFLLWVLAVALSSTVLEHLAFASHESGSYGASGIVYACIAAGALLAPKSRIHFTLWLYSLRNYDIGLLAAALGYLALEVGRAATGYALRTEGALPYTPLLHLAGFAIGGGLAYLGLKLRLVDAGGWDWLSRRGRTSTSAKLGDFVAPDVDAAPRTHKPKPPSCEHCGRVRPDHLLRCIYCGKA